MWSGFSLPSDRFELVRRVEMRLSRNTGGQGRRFSRGGLRQYISILIATAAQWGGPNGTGSPSIKLAVRNERQVGPPVVG